MTRILVTGGTGVLGRRIVRQLQVRGATVRVLSRHAAESRDAAVEWVHGDLLTGAGLLPAFAGVDVVVHSATSRKAQEDRAVTRHLLAAARTARVQHAVYISVVGIDTLTFSAYYAAKLEGERLFAASEISCSVQRATQFHDFVAFLLNKLDRLPVVLIPRNAILQPVDPEAVASRVATAAMQRTTGRLPDHAGPELQMLGELARSWLRARRKHKPVFPAPLPLPVFKAMSSGKLASSTAEKVGCPWETWLAWQAGTPTDGDALPSARR